MTILLISLGVLVGLVVGAISVLHLIGSLVFRPF